MGLCLKQIFKTIVRKGYQDKIHSVFGSSDESVATPEEGINGVADDRPALDISNLEKLKQLLNVRIAMEEQPKEP